jgi:ATP-binding cassette subfamily F protein uup
MAAQATPDSGLVANRQGLRVALLGQSCQLPKNQTVEAVLEEACQYRRSMFQAYREATAQLAAIPEVGIEHRRLQEECTQLHHQLDTHDAWHIDHEIKRVSIALELVPGDRKLDTLSGGELRRVDLAVQIIQRPDVLLLDEPTNHIDTRSAEWIEGYLARYEGSCVLVTHDRYFLDRVVNRIVEIEFSKIYSYPGSYEKFLNYKSQVEEAEHRADKNRLSLIRRELQWFKRGAKARSTKQKARIDRLREVQSEDSPQRSRDFIFEIPQPERLGKNILTAEKVAFSYADEQLFKDFSLDMQRGMRIGILGPNGSGKTTLLRVLRGEVSPTRGRVKIGENTSFLYVGQSHDDVQPDRAILDYVSDGSEKLTIDKKTIFVPEYLSKFLFDRDSLRATIGKLSGGERNRLILAKHLLRGGNFLVLDEPTNDLDLYTLRVLEETIQLFDGCALVVSHDRYFLNRICTHMLVFESDGTITQIPGNYNDYLLHRKRQTSEKEESSPKKKQTKAVAAGGKRRLTYKEKEELGQIEKSVEDAEAQVQELESAIAEPGFYQQDHLVVQATLEELEEARRSVDDLYVRWEALEALR